MADNAPQQVSYLTFTVENFNPNHRVRFISLTEPTCYLFDLSTAVADDSFYLAPKLRQPITIQITDQEGQAISAAAAPTEDVHLSFHDSGAVNLHAGGSRYTMRPPGAGRGANGLAARLVFNSVTLFRPASLDEINSLAKKYTQIPVAGFWELWPICLDIYQVDAGAEWVMPGLADTFQIHVCVKPQRKHSVYHFLVWQHSKAERYPAEMTVLYSPI